MSNSLTRCLQECLVESALIKTDTNGYMALVERDIMRVNLVDVPRNVIAINLSKFKHFSGVKNGPWTQTCDYLIIDPKSEKNLAIFIELKRTIRPGTRGKDQLLRSLPVFKYLHTM